MKFRHLHSIKEVPYGLFTLHVQLDFTIGEKIREYIEEKVHEVNKKIPIYKKIRDIMIREEDFIRTTTKKIKRQANI